MIFKTMELECEITTDYHCDFDCFTINLIENKIEINYRQI